MYQVQVVKLSLIRIGLGRVNGNSDPIHNLLLFFNDIFNNMWVPGGHMQAFSYGCHALLVKRPQANRLGADA